MQNPYEKWCFLRKFKFRFDSPIRNHIKHPDTENWTIWFWEKKVCEKISFAGLYFPFFRRRHFLGRGSMDIGQKINGSIDFFGLFATLAVHRITNTYSISTSSGANRIYSARAVHSAHLFHISFEWKNRKSTKQVEVFRKFQFRAGWPPYTQGAKSIAARRWRVGYHGTVWRIGVVCIRDYPDSPHGTWYHNLALGQ